jgi:L-ascorbate metabolism protein UlaG (beta-lactamase superfamily)
VRLTWLGHATVLIEAAGVRLLTDPVLRRRVAHLRRHAPAVDVPRDVDAVLLSHAHRDHLDLPTLRALAPPPPLVVAAPGTRGALRAIRRLDGVAVREVAAGHALDVGDARISATVAVHDVQRTPLGASSDAVGFVVEAAGRRAYFAGDTEVFPAMEGLGPLDVALLPIWGWGPSLGPGHMDPAEAVEALALLRPRVVIPIHWGTLLPIGLHRRHGHLLRDPVEDFARLAAERCPDVEVAILRPGQDLTL